LLTMFPRVTSVHVLDQTTVSQACWEALSAHRPRPMLDLGPVVNETTLSSYFRELWGLEDNEWALFAINRLLQLQPNNVKHLTDRGKTNGLLQRLEDALTDWSRACELSPQDAELHNFRGLTLLHLGRLKEAIQEFGQAVTLRADDFIYWNNRALAFLKCGDSKRALEDFTQCLERSKTNASAFYNRSRVLTELKRYDEAVADLTECLRLQPNDLAAHWRWGRLLELRGKADEAKAYYQQTQARNLKLKDAEDRHALGRLLAFTGKDAEAIEVFNNALRLQPCNEEYLLSRAQSRRAINLVGDAMVDEDTAGRLRQTNRGTL